LHRRCQALDDSPNKKYTNGQQSYRVEQVGVAQQLAGKTRSQAVGQNQKYKRDLIGKIVDAVHDQAEAVRAYPRGDLHDEDGCVELYRTDEGRTTM
jgi:hypothetical protein